MDGESIPPAPAELMAASSLFVQLVPQMSRFLTTLGEVPYEHPSLATNPDFLSGTPAKSLIPSKEPTGSRRVPIKRPPAWKLEPDLQAFGPYFKAAGVTYSPQDLSTLARAVPDVCFYFVFIFIFTDCSFPRLPTLLMVPASRVLP